MSEICLKKNNRSQMQIVYVTDTGKKYHLENCYGAYIDIDLKTALKIYSPCSRCRPPTKLIQNQLEENDKSIFDRNFNSLPTSNNSLFSSDQNNIPNFSGNFNEISLISFMEKSLLEENCPSINKNFAKNLINLLKNLENKITNLTNENLTSKENQIKLEKKVETFNQKIKEKEIIHAEKITNLENSLNNLTKEVENLQEKISENFKLTEKLSSEYDTNVKFYSEKIEKIEKVLKLQFDVYKQNKEKWNSLNKSVENFPEEIIMPALCNNLTIFKEELLKNLDENFEDKLFCFNSEIEKMRFDFEKRENESLKIGKIVKKFYPDVTYVNGNYLHKNLFSKFAIRKNIRENKRKLNLLNKSNGDLIKF